MTECNWCKDEICVNADCPICCDYCPVPDTEGVCKFEDRSERHFTVVDGRMKEYIDREEALLAIKQAFEKGERPSLYIKSIPAADVTEVRHGKWIHSEIEDDDWGRTFHEWTCSVCGYSVGHNPTGENYCSNCGVRMGQITYWVPLPEPQKEETK